MNFDPKLAKFEKERGLFAVANLHAGLILMTIGAAAWEFTEPAFEAPITWDDGVFLYDDLNGTRVIIWADRRSVIGLCRHRRSERHVWHTHDPTGAESLITAMPAGLQEHARRLASDYLRVEFEEGRDVPCVTAGFWSDDGWWLTAAEPWPGVLQNGAEDVLGPALMPLDRALDWLQRRLGLSDRQTMAVRSLYERRISCEGGRLITHADDLRSLASENDIGLEYIRQTYRLGDTNVVESVAWGANPVEDRCRELLRAVGIEVS